MSKYRKALVAFSGWLAVVVTVLEDGSISGDEAVAIGVAAITAIGVYLAPNKAA